jgi:septal ring factor EnvC (AmiA/AmiB activator)
MLLGTVVVRIICYSTAAAECRKEVIFIEDIEIVLERHEQRIKTLERDMSEMKGVQAEIRSMNETLVTLATELKHTNEHLARHEQKIEEIDGAPKQRLQQIATAIIAALAGGIISMIISMVFV